MGLTSEGDVLQPGGEHRSFIARAGSESMHVGLACCFDLRFPEWLSQYGPRPHRSAGPVDLLLAPSAFLEVTGAEHWDLLIRRAALDGQCYVVAPNVAFDRLDSTPLHGRSAVVDPFGRVMAQCGAQGDDLAIGDVRRARIEQVRAQLPLTQWDQ
eukprot:TRINITY_DN30652_c0_g1_i1.p1 TRINITY_DN30652_c0_g1~~TRINITY_DN30652_c0_g1_i1.p1  ORF type:complete len:155 (-),score=26.61 TRINITY_DN30652_c0_g1_i1:12-476(-)